MKNFVNNVEAFSGKPLDLENISEILPLLDPRVREEIENMKPSQIPHELALLLQDPTVGDITKINETARKLFNLHSAAKTLEENTPKNGIPTST